MDGDDGGNECPGNSQHHALRDPYQMLLKPLAMVAHRHGGDEQRLPGGEIEDAVISDRPGKLRVLWRELPEYPQTPRACQNVGGPSMHQEHERWSRSHDQKRVEQKDIRQIERTM